MKADTYEVAAAKPSRRKLAWNLNQGALIALILSTLLVSATCILDCTILPNTNG